jgi:hypothetical protein
MYDCLKERAELLGQRADPTFANDPAVDRANRGDLRPSAA